MRTFTVVVALCALFPAASTASGDSPAPAARIAKAKSGLSGIAVGVELGEPTSLLARYTAGSVPVAAQLAVGTGTAAGQGLQLRFDVTYRPAVVLRKPSSLVATYVGASVRRYHHGYSPASVDELDDTHIGVRAVVGSGYQLLRLGLELFGEAGLGYDLDRTPSCSLASGVASTCPHSATSRVFVQAAIGARYYFGP